MEEVKKDEIVETKVETQPEQVVEVKANKELDIADKALDILNQIYAGKTPDITVPSETKTEEEVEVKTKPEVVEPKEEVKTSEVEDEKVVVETQVEETTKTEDVSKELIEGLLKQALQPYSELIDKQNEMIKQLTDNQPFGLQSKVAKIQETDIADLTVEKIQKMYDFGNEF